MVSEMLQRWVGNINQHLVSRSSDLQKVELENVVKGLQSKLSSLWR